MTEGGVEPSAPGAAGGGKHENQFLKKKVAGLPVWAWGLILAAGVGVGIYILRRQQSNQTPGTGSTAADNALSQSIPQTSNTDGSTDQDQDEDQDQDQNKPPPKKKPGGGSHGQLPTGTKVWGGGPEGKKNGQYQRYWYQSPGGKQTLLTARTQADVPSGQTPYLPIGTLLDQVGGQWQYQIPGESAWHDLIMAGKGGGGETVRSRHRYSVLT